MKSYITFKHPYVLIEDTKGRYQAIYKEYTKEIPQIYLDSPALCCPFTPARRTTKPKKQEKAKSGFCEVCYLKFDNYRIHVETKSHLAYARHPANYRVIDAFIESMQGYTSLHDDPIASSPCDHMAIEFSQCNIPFESGVYNSESLIRLSKNTSEDEQGVVQFETILTQISRNYSQGK